MAELYRYRDLVAAEGEEDLFRLFAQAQVERNEFLAEGPPAPPSGERPPDVRAELASSLLGGALVRRMRQGGLSPQRLEGKGKGGQGRGQDR